MCNDSYADGTEDVANAVNDIDLYIEENSNSPELADAEVFYAFNQDKKELEATMNALLTKVREVTVLEDAYVQVIYSGHGVKFERVAGGKAKSDTYALHHDGKSTTNLTKFVRKLSKTPHTKNLGYFDCCRSMMKGANASLNTDEG